jgi:3-dehydroquinate synthase
MTDNIVFTSDPGGEIARFVRERKYSKICVLADDQTALHCYPLLSSALPAHHLIKVASGEEHKNLQTCELVWREMTQQNLDRHSVMIVIGGGVLGDMGGFCAATYKRGIDFILVPTTLLSQVDASIGGKLGIDFLHFKNHIGVFQTPALTVLFSGFLSTLPEAEKRSGFAEVIKHALIADADMWEEIRKHPLDAQPWGKLIPHSVEIKRKVVTSDRFETGLRKTLNAGHTIGHAVETHLLGANRKILHGEAVAAGLVCEAWLAWKKNMLTTEAFESIQAYLLDVFGKVPLTQEDEEPVALLALQDKKNKGNRILCVLLEGVGNAKWDCEISPEEVKEAIAFYRRDQDK